MKTHAGPNTEAMEEAINAEAKRRTAAYISSMNRVTHREIHTICSSAQSLKEENENSSNTSSGSFKSSLNNLLLNARSLADIHEAHRLMEMLDSDSIIMESHPYDLSCWILRALNNIQWHADRKIDYKVELGLFNHLPIDVCFLQYIIETTVRVTLKMTSPERLSLYLSGSDQKRRLPGQDVLVRFTVEITGNGRRGRLKNMFKRLQEAEKGLKELMYGTNVGLLVAKRLLTHIGGKMWIESSGNDNDNDDDDGDSALAKFHFEFKTQVAEPELDIKKLHTTYGRRVLFLDQNISGFGAQLREHLQALSLRHEVVKVKTDFSLEESRPPMRSWYDCVIVESTDMVRRLREIERFKSTAIVIRLLNPLPLFILPHTLTYPVSS